MSTSKPNLIAYTAKDKGCEKTYWHRIGAAWKTKDGDGFNIQLDSLPLDGRIVLMPPKADDKES